MLYRFYIETNSKDGYPRRKLIIPNILMHISYIVQFIYRVIIFLLFVGIIVIGILYNPNGILDWLQKYSNTNHIVNTVFMFFQCISVIVNIIRNIILTVVPKNPKFKIIFIILNIIVGFFDGFKKGILTCLFNTILTSIYYWIFINTNSISLLENISIFFINGFAIIFLLIEFIFSTFHINLIDIFSIYLGI
jgi:hypothetical protein